MSILQIHFLSHIFLSMLAMKAIEAFLRSFFDADGRTDRLTACEWSKIFQKANFLKKSHTCPSSRKWQLAATGPVLLLELDEKLYESSSILPKKHAKQHTKT